MRNENKNYQNIDSIAELWINLIFEQIKNKNKKKNKYEKQNS